MVNSKANNIMLVIQKMTKISTRVFVMANGSAKNANNIITP